MTRSTARGTVGRRRPKSLRPAAPKIPCRAPSGQIVPQNERRYTIAMASMPTSRITELAAVRRRKPSPVSSEYRVSRPPKGHKKSTPAQRPSPRDFRCRVTIVVMATSTTPSTTQRTHRALVRAVRSACRSSADGAVSFVMRSLSLVACPGPRYDAAAGLADSLSGTCEQLLKTGRQCPAHCRPVFTSAPGWSALLEDALLHPGADVSGGEAVLVLDLAHGSVLLVGGSAAGRGGPRGGGAREEEGGGEGGIRTHEAG